MGHTETRCFLPSLDFKGDVATVLGRATGDEGQLCGDINDNGEDVGAINKWAAYKPVRKNKLGNLSRAELAEVNFGLIPPSTYNTAAGTRGSVWVYGKPRGINQNPAEYFRITDFDGYYTEAPAPCGPLGDISVALSQTSTYSFGAAISPPVAGGESVTWSDLTSSIGNYYLCVIFAKGGADLSGDQLGKTSVQTLSNDGIVLDITQAELTTLYNNGYKYYYLCAVSTSNADSQSLSNPFGWGTRSYMALPTPNGTTDVNGKFTITAAPIQNIIIQSVTSVQSPTRALQFFDATNFRGADELTPTNNKYFKVTDSLNNGKYYFQIGLSVTAGNQSFTIGSNAINLSRTFVSQGGFTSKKNVTLYDTDASGNLVQANQITIPAGQTKVVYLVTSLSALMSLNISGVEEVNTDPQYFSVRVFIYQGIPSTLIGQDDIRVRNYDFPQ